MRVEIRTGDSVFTVERFPDKTNLLGVDVRTELESGEKHFFNVLDLMEDWICGEAVKVSVGKIEITLRPLNIDFEGSSMLRETYAGLKFLEIKRDDVTITAEF